ncbi:MAG TPA: hypothetical protein VGD24_02335 [Gallionella sp.]
MPRSHHPVRDKDMKKQPMMTPKEKRKAKHAKKHSEEAQPLIPPPTHH